MRKLFFAICFICVGIWTTSVWSGTRELIDPIEINKVKNNQDISFPTAQKKKDELPQTKEEFIKYIRERMKKVPVTTMDMVEKNSGLGIIHSNEYIAQQVQDSKSTFRKIYEKALSRVTLDEYVTPLNDLKPAAPSEAKLKSELALENNNLRPEKLGFDIISVDLPNGQRVTVPAKEHIPYMLSEIEIMPDGLVKIKETVTVIANGQKLKHGLIKALPKYSVSRDGIRNSTIPYLSSVKINGTETEYTLKDGFDRFLIMPKKKLPLQSGIYTYEFDYVLDRKLWYYKDFNELYWDVTGSYWNLVISKAIATVRLPINVMALGQNLMVGFLPNDITEDGTVISMDRATNSLGFTTEVPLIAGEGMFMLVRIPKTGFIDPDFNKKFKWFVEDYGEMVFALLGLIMILGAYVISWKNINNSANNVTRVKFARTPMLYRMLAKGVYDRISFGAFLLDMYRRGIINIVKDNDKILLTKRSGNFGNLDYYHQKAMRQIFNRKENSYTVKHDNILRLNKASSLIEKDTYKRLKWLLLKLNAGYVIFSFLMLLLIELAIAYLKVDTWQVFGVLVSATITIAFYWWILFMKIKNRFLMFLVKLFAIILIIISCLMMTAYISPLSMLFIIVMIYTIFKYSGLFTRRNGLIKYNIIEAKNMADSLRTNAENIILGNQFAKNQPIIFALEAESAYQKAKETEGDMYRIDLVAEILKFL